MAFLVNRFCVDYNLKNLDDLSLGMSFRVSGDIGDAFTKILVVFSR